jgi:hypothetical protein
MSINKIAGTLSLVSALSLVCYGPAQSAPLTSLSAAAKLGTEQTDALQVRWRGRWHVGGANTSPYYYGGSYLGYTYGGFSGYPAYGCEFPCWRPYGWYRPNYRPWH